MTFYTANTVQVQPRDEQYLPAAPTLRGDGIALQTGDRWYSTVDYDWNVWTGAAWVSEDAAGAGDFKADGSVPMTGPISMQGFAINNLGDPVGPIDASTRQYVDLIAYEDPGDAGQIYQEESPPRRRMFVGIEATTDETRVLDDPLEEGLVLTLSLVSTPANTVTVAITADSPIDANGRTVFYLHYNYTAGSTGGETVTLVSVDVGGTPEWRIVSENKSTGIPDLLDGNAIPHDGRSGDSSMSVGVGAETRTLAIPTHQGQLITLVLSSTGGGTLAVTSSEAINLAGNTVATFTLAGSSLSLIAVKIGGVLRWRVLANDGAVLT